MMASIFSDFCTFFGISGAPASMAELLPWLMQVLLAIGLIGAAFNLLREWGGILISGGRVRK